MACKYGLLSTNCGLLWGMVADDFSYLAFQVAVNHEPGTPVNVSAYTYIQVHICHICYVYIGLYIYI